MRVVDENLHGNDRTVYENGRSVASILTDMKAEFVEFVRVRATMLLQELRDKWKTLKLVLPMVVVAAVLLWTAWIMFTLAIVGLLLAAFPQNVFRWFFAFIIVAVLWGIVGAAAAYFAKRELQQNSMVPKRTIEVLKGDKIWIQAEVNNRV